MSWWLMSYWCTRSCNSHAPLISHAEQLSGCRSRIIFSVSRRRRSRKALFVLISIPSAAFAVQAVTGVGVPATSTTHMRHAPSGFNAWV